MCGAAKLLPVARSVLPPNHATSRSTPRAKNSTGGLGFAYHSQESSPSWEPDRDHRREAPRIALDRHVVRRGDEHRAAEVGGVGELVQELGELALRRREAEVDDLEALLDRVAETAEDQVGAAGVALAEHADAVDPAGRRERADDPRAGGAVPADVADRVGLDRGHLAVERHRDRALDPADERMVAVDAAVEDADVDALAGRSSDRPVPRDPVGPLGRDADRRRPPRR